MYLLIFSFYKDYHHCHQKQYSDQDCCFHTCLSPALISQCKGFFFFFSFLWSWLSPKQPLFFSLQGQPLEGIRGMTSGLSRAVAGLKPPRHSSVTDSGQATVLCLHHFRSSLWNRGCCSPGASTFVQLVSWFGLDQYLERILYTVSSHHPPPTSCTLNILI